MSDFTVQELTLGQLLENTAARFPDIDAVIHADRELRQTWSEFSACVDDMARGLMAIGVQKGEKVAVWATNVPHWVTLMFATARIAGWCAHRLEELATGNRIMRPAYRAMLIKEPYIPVDART